MSKLENVMDDVPSQTTKQRPERALPFERVALVLQGGGALGARSFCVGVSLAKTVVRLAAWASSPSFICSACLPRRTSPGRS